MKKLFYQNCRQCHKFSYSPSFIFSLLWRIFKSFFLLLSEIWDLEFLREFLTQRKIKFHVVWLFQHFFSKNIILKTFFSIKLKALKIETLPHLFGCVFSFSVCVFLKPTHKVLCALFFHSSWCCCCGIHENKSMIYDDVIWIFLMRQQECKHCH